MVPPRKVVSMEVVPLNRIKWLLSTLVPPTEKMTKYTGPTQDTKDDRVVKNSVIFCVLGGTSVLSHFILLSGTTSIVFWVEPFEKSPCIYVYKPRISWLALHTF